MSKRGIRKPNLLILLGQEKMGAGVVGAVVVVVVGAVDLCESCGLEGGGGGGGGVVVNLVTEESRVVRVWVL